MTSIVSAGDFNGDGKADIVARDSSRHALALPRHRHTAASSTRIQIGAGWNSMNTIIGAGDFNGDGKADLIARDSSGNLWLYRGNGAGSFLGRIQIGSGWNGMNAIVGSR